MLARVPPPASGVRGGLWTIHDSESPHSDAVRRLRTNLEFANLDRQARMVMITSAVSEEGKSTTAADLAVAFAQAGRNVTLVDLDLRKPTIAELFRLRPGFGLTDVVIGRTTLEKAIVTVPLPTTSSVAESRDDSIGSLNVLPAGTLPASPGQFIGTAALGRTLEHLRETQSLVLVDTPPLLAVGDAASLSAHMDGIVVIARLDRITRGVLSRLSNELHASGATKLGVVITGVNIRGIAYEYGYRRPPNHVPRSQSRAEGRLDPSANGSGQADDRAAIQPGEAQAEPVSRARRRAP